MNLIFVLQFTVGILNRKAHFIFNIKTRKNYVIQLFPNIVFDNHLIVWIGGMRALKKKKKNQRKMCKLPIIFFGKQHKLHLLNLICSN
jgi:hypothetical protein